MSPQRVRSTHYSYISWNWRPVMSQRALPTIRPSIHPTWLRAKTPRRRGGSAHFDFHPALKRLTFKVRHKNTGGALLKCALCEVTTGSDASVCEGNCLFAREV